MNNRHNSFDDLSKLIDTFIDPFSITKKLNNNTSTSTICNQQQQQHQPLNFNFNSYNNNNIYNTTTANTSNGFSPLSISLDNLINLDTINCDVNNTIIHDDTFINYPNFYNTNSNNNNNNTRSAITTSVNDHHELTTNNNDFNRYLNIIPNHSHDTSTMPFNHNNKSHNNASLSLLSISPNFSNFASTSPITNVNAFINQNSNIKTFLDAEREPICINSR